MSNIGLFAVGSVVTLLVLAALALLFWGAILDGRYDDEQRAAADEAVTRAGQDPALHRDRRSVSV